VQRGNLPKGRGFSLPTWDEPQIFRAGLRYASFHLPELIVNPEVWIIPLESASWGKNWRCAKFASASSRRGAAKTAALLSKKL